MPSVQMARRSSVALLLLLVGTTTLPAQRPNGALSPIALSDPDGQELQLTRMDVRVAIAGLLSLTEVELRFQNPRNRVAEGRFTLVLPPDATISRFAKEVDGTLMEGEVVERRKANQVYDDILLQMRDPALLEQDLGNRFSARIFPIDPRSEVRLLLSYTQSHPLTGGDRSYSFPLRGLPQIDHFTFRAEIASQSRAGTNAAIPSERPFEMTRKRFVPTEDINVSIPTLSESRVSMAGDYFMAILKPAVKGDSAQMRSVRTWRLFLDTSASSAEGAEHRIVSVEQFLLALPDRANVELIAFDQSMERLFEGPAPEAAAALRSAIERRLFLGGTDLEKVLAHIAATSMRGDAAVLVSDGVATMGKSNVSDLVRTIGNVPDGVLVHALVLGAREGKELERIVRGRGHLARVRFTAGFEADARTAATRLQEPLGIAVDLKSDGVEWIYPERFENVRPGDEVVAVGKRRGTRNVNVVAVAANQIAARARSSEMIGRAFSPLFEREAHRIYIEYLGERALRETDAAAKRALEEEQTRISIERRILIPSTTLLVLETEADFVRYGIDRRALASILAVGTNGIDVIDRRDPDYSPPLPSDSDPSLPQLNQGAPSGTIDVNVRFADRNRGQAIVAIVGNPALSKSLTDAGGQLKTEAPAGEYIVYATAAGYTTEYQRITVRGGRSSTVAFRLRKMRQESSVAKSSIRGLVSDSSGAALPGVSVEAKGDGGEKRCFSDANGWFICGPLPVGTYLVSASLEGLETSSAIARIVNVSPTIELVMRPSSVSQSITVTGDAPILGGADEESIASRDEVEGDEPSEDHASNGSPRPQSLPLAWAGKAVVRPAAELAKELAANPGSREHYNALADALWRDQRWSDLRALAIRWQPLDPDNPQIYEMIGEAALALGKREEAIRAFGSLVEIGPAKPEMLQRAGLLLFRAGEKEQALVPLRRAIESRPDRLNAHRHLALILWLNGEHEDAAGILEAALEQKFPNSRVTMHERILREELGYIYRSWISVASGPQAQAIRQRAHRHRIDLKQVDALRVTASWDSNANDVDLHLIEPTGVEIFYSSPESPSGMQLYEDITTGFGPEVIRAEKAQGEYAVGITYYNAGPMGVARGTLIIIKSRAGKDEPEVQIVPFRLVEQDASRTMLVTRVAVEGKHSR